MRTSRFTLALLAVLAAVGLFASCGGADDGLTETASADEVDGTNNDDSFDDGASDDASDDDSSDDSSDDEASDDDSGDDESSDDETVDTASGDVEVVTDAGDFCAVWNEFASVDTAAGASPEELRDLYADFDEKAEQFVDAAPDEIRADAETVADASRAMRDLLEEYDYDFSAASLDPAFAEAFNEDALDASLRVADYAIANC